MRRKPTSDVWWKNAVVYCLDVETFLDSDGDGCGDLAGLIDRIDYLAGMGVSCLWLMPFYPSVQRDDGYDITDFYGVDGRLGTPGDFTELIRTAADRGIRVIADLVMNHTSVDHPWFQAGRDRESPYHDFYVWADEKPEEKPGDVVFPDKEKLQLEVGPEGEAVVSAPLLLAPAGPQRRQSGGPRRDRPGRRLLARSRGSPASGSTPCRSCSSRWGCPRARSQDPHELLRELRRFMGRRRGDAILMGEVNLPPDEQRAFFGDEDGDELHMVLNFTVNQAMYLAFARGEAEPLVRALRALPEIPEDSQWANFVRNHDELTLDKLAEDERAGGLRRLRPRGAPPALRARPAAAAPVDGRRRPGPHPPRLLARLLAARARPCCSTARRSGWGRTWRSRAATACARRCSGHRSATAASRPATSRAGRSRPATRRWRRSGATPTRS